MSEDFNTDIPKLCANVRVMEISQAIANLKSNFHHNSFVNVKSQEPILVLLGKDGNECESCQGHDRTMTFILSFIQQGTLKSLILCVCSESRSCKKAEIFTPPD